MDQDANLEEDPPITALRLSASASAGRPATGYTTDTSSARPVITTPLSANIRNPANGFVPNTSSSTRPVATNSLPANIRNPANGYAPNTTSSSRPVATIPPPANIRNPATGYATNVSSSARPVATNPHPANDRNPAQTGLSTTSIRETDVSAKGISLETVNASLREVFTRLETIAATLRGHSQVLDVL